LWAVFEAERPQRVPCAGRFDGFHSVPALDHCARTNGAQGLAVQDRRRTASTVRFDSDEDQELIRGINSLRNTSSVMAGAVGRPVGIRACAERIEVRQGEPSRRHRFEPDGARAIGQIPDHRRQAARRPRDRGVHRRRHADQRDTGA
jgi:hypothetical protein